MAFMIASSIISTGGQIGSYGPIYLVLLFYSNNLYLIIIYLFLLMTTILILPLFLFIQNFRVLDSFYIKLIKEVL